MFQSASLQNHHHPLWRRNERKIWEVHCCNKRNGLMYELTCSPFCDELWFPGGSQTMGHFHAGHAGGIGSALNFWWDHALCILITLLPKQRLQEFSGPAVLLFRPGEKKKTKMAVFEELTHGLWERALSTLKVLHQHLHHWFSPWQNEMHQSGLHNVSQSGSWMDCQSGSGPAPPAGTYKPIRSCCYTGL